MGPVAIYHLSVDLNLLRALHMYVALLKLCFKFIIQTQHNSTN